MRYSVQLVNPFDLSAFASIISLRFALFAALRCEGQNYSKAPKEPQVLFRTNGKKLVSATSWQTPGSRRWFWSSWRRAGTEFAYMYWQRTCSFLFAQI